MNWVVVGQGAIGLLWFKHLADNKLLNVSLKCSKRMTNPPNSLSFTSLTQQQQQIPLNVTTKTELKRADVILLCVKSFQIAEVISEITNHLSANTIIILSHNGLGTLEQLPKKVIENHTLLALLTTHGAKRLNDFSIVHTGQGSSDLGIISGELTPATTKQLTCDLNNALPEVFWQTNIKEKQWLKLAINCVINPITAINNIENGDVLSKKYQPLVDSLLQEVIAIAKIEDINFNFEQLKSVVENVARLTAKNSSSMRCDINEMRPTEIDFINGFIHQLGAKHQVPTPNNSMLWQQVKNLTIK